MQDPKHFIKNHVQRVHSHFVCIGVCVFTHAFLTTVIVLSEEATTNKKAIVTEEREFNPKEKALASHTVRLTP